MSDFADRLLHAREQAGLSQTELGELCDMAGTQISRYESGRAVPRRATIKRLAMALSVAPEWLAKGDGAPDQFFAKLDFNSHPPRPILKTDSDIEKKFVELAAFEGMTPEDFLRKLLINHLEHLGNKLAQTGLLAVNQIDSQEQPDDEATQLAQIVKRLARLEDAVYKKVFSDSSKT